MPHIRSLRLISIALLPASVLLSGCLDDTTDPGEEGGGGSGAGGSDGGSGAVGNTGGMPPVGGSGGTPPVGGGGEGGMVDPCFGGCDDANPCTTDTCDPSSGCVNAPVMDGTDCGDGNACNGDETCQAGTCTSSPDLDCDDGNQCTVDTCDMATGCVNTIDDGGACDDGVACTGNDVCDALGACAGTPDNALCADGNLCTDDLCDAVAGCVNPDISAACDDGDMCNGVETCDPLTGCAMPGPLGAYEGFESGAAAWTTGLMDPASTTLIGWTLATATGGLAPLGFSSTAYGTPNNGDVGEEHSFLQSPVYDLSAGGTVKFHTFSSNEDFGFDEERLEVSYDGGATWQVLIDSIDERWCSFAEWVPMEAVIDPAEGTPNTVFRFVYDTIDDCCGPTDIVGWYVDNFAVEPNGVMGCDDSDPCTVDICVNNGCVNEVDAAGCFTGPYFCSGGSE